MITAQDASNILVFIDRALKDECRGIQEAAVAARLQATLSEIIKQEQLVNKLKAGDLPKKDTDEDGEDTPTADQ